MPKAGLNDDFTAHVVMRTEQMEWQASPSPTVWRKRLELSGPAEAGRVTSVVRYDPDSSFHSHPHPDGEEILVLDGVFSDESGDYGPGSFLLNPEGFSHAPFSKQGCVLFVKLRQYPGKNRRPVRVDTNAAEWQPRGIPGVESLTLYDEPDHPEKIRLVRFAPGSHFPDHAHPGGEEVFILEGGIEDDYGTFGTGCWGRYPVGSRHKVYSEQGCLLYVKTGHLAG